MAAVGDLGWELAAEDRRQLLALLERIEAPKVVELGAGPGTLALARGVAGRDGRLTSVEHDRAWVARVSEELGDAGLAEIARVFHAPLRPHPLAEPGQPWYSQAALRGLPDRIDLLLVDGPPAGEPGSELARAPALEVLESRLAPCALVVLDDIHRVGEQEVIERWQSRTAFRFQAPAGRRIAVGSRPGR